MKLEVHGNLISHGIDRITGHESVPEQIYG